MAWCSVVLATAAGNSMAGGIGKMLAAGRSVCESL